MIPLILRLGLAGVVVVAPIRGNAQDQRREPPDSVRTRLSTVSVTTGRGTATVGSTAAVVIAIDSLRLTPAAPLDRVLREVPFLLARVNSRGETELSVRGSDSRQAAVLFDGLPLSIGWDHRSDASVFPTTGVGRVVVVRGLSSLLQGPNALGGVVDLGLSSYRGEQASRTQVGVRAGGDQMGTQALQGDVTHPVSWSRGVLTLRAGAGVRDVPALALSHRVTDRYTSDGDERTNSDVNQRDGFVSARFQSPDGAWVGASYSGYSLERGVTPELHIAAPRFWRYPEQTRHLALVTMGSGRRRTPLGSGDAEFVAGQNSAYTSIESFLDQAYDSIVGRETGDERTTTARLTMDHSLGGGELRSAFTVSTVDYDEGLDRAGGGAAVGGDVAPDGWGLARRQLHAANRRAPAVGAAVGLGRAAGAQHAGLWRPLAAPRVGESAGAIRRVARAVLGGARSLRAQPDAQAGAPHGR
jgi:iron complex outermembrane recepter protein